MKLKPDEPIQPHYNYKMERCDEELVPLVWWLAVVLLASVLFGAVWEYLLLPLAQLLGIHS